MVQRLNRHCAYFPCHVGLEDCTFCYCPFYPCEDLSIGKFIKTRKNTLIWSCEDCSWIHKSDIVDKIFGVIRNSGLKARSSSSKRVLNKTGIIILGHGSKLKKANDTVRKVAREVDLSGIGALAVEPAYLQSCQPDLKKMIEKMAKKGCKKMIIVPFFLFMGNHVTRDIPAAIRKEASIHKNIKFIYAKSLGHDSRITDIVMSCIREAAR